MLLLAASGIEVLQEGIFCSGELLARYVGQAPKAADRNQGNHSAHLSFVRYRAVGKERGREGGREEHLLLLVAFFPLSDSLRYKVSFTFAFVSSK